MNSRLSEHDTPDTADAGLAPAVVTKTFGADVPKSGSADQSRQSGGDAPDIAIRVRGLVNRFGEQVVHDGLDLDVRRGEILGVVGGSGTGKSVLMRSILGLNHPQAGSITVLGANAMTDDPADRERIEHHSGVLFQDGALFSSLTVAENVALPLKEFH